MMFYWIYIYKGEKVNKVLIFKVNYFYNNLNDMILDYNFIK